MLSRTLTKLLKLPRYVKHKFLAPTAQNLFQNKIMQTIVTESQNHYTNNFDSYRFKPEDENKFDTVLHAHFLTYITKNAGLFEEGYNALASQYSKDLYLKLIAYKVLGHKRVKVLEDLDQHWANRKRAENLPSEKAEIDLQGTFAHFRRYHFDFNDQKITFEGQHSNIAWSFFLKQYHYEREGIVIKPERGDFIIDAGACYGDTALSFATDVGDDGKIYSFDFIPAHIKAIQNNINLNPWAKNIVKVLPFALGKASNTAQPYQDDDKRMRSGASLLSNAMPLDQIPIRSIDDLYTQGEIKRVDFIKMDIEGYEVPALKGAKNVIKKFKPKLAISLYHKLDDFYTIPKLILALNPHYKLYIDHYTPHAEETVLYAYHNES